MLPTRAVATVAALTGIALELGIEVVSGRREAWDSPQFWTIGLPCALIVSALTGWRSRGRDWRWTVLVAPSQVLTMMVRSGELGSLWPLAVALSAILSAPFVGAACLGARFRSR